MGHATRYATIFNSLPFGLIAADDRGLITMGNPAAERLLGWRLAAWRGQALALHLERAISDPALALCWTVALSQALGQGQTTYLNLPAEFSTAFDDGHCVSVTGVVAPWIRADGERSGVIVMLHDHAQSENAAELRNRFFGVISHELGSPVTNIAAAADLLAQQAGPAPTAQRRLIQIVQDEASRFRRMIGQFLATSPASAGSIQPARQVVTLRPLLTRVAQTFGIRDLGGRLVLQVPPDLPFVEGDADRIQEVLCNLIDNAARYSPDGSPIVLAATERPHDVLVSVSDEGHGVPAGDADRIFEPFYRGYGGDQETGQGVGLYIVKSLIRALGGELWHEPQPDGGTRFCFTLVRAPTLPNDIGEEDGRHDPDC